MSTPYKTLKSLGACDLWLKRAKGKTWKQLHDYARSRKPGFDTYTGQKNSGLFWKWLMMATWGGLDKNWFLDHTITPEKLNETLALLPLSAWKEALLAKEKYLNSLYPGSKYLTHSRSIHS